MTTGIGIMCFMTWEIMLFGDLWNTEEHSENDYLLYCKQHGAKAGYVCDIPLMKMGELEEIIMFVHGLLTDEYEMLSN